jgi:LSU ribosomal protein L28P
MSSAWRRSWTVPRSISTPAPAACALVKLPARS